MQILTNNKEYHVQPQPDGFIRTVRPYDSITDTWGLSVENPVEVTLPVVTNPRTRHDGPALPPLQESVTILTGLTEDQAKMAADIVTYSVGLCQPSVDLTGSLEDTYQCLQTIWKARFEKEGQTPKLTRLLLNFIFCATLGLSGGMTIRNFLDNDWENLNAAVMFNSAVILIQFNRSNRLEDKLRISNLEAWRLQTRVMQLESTNNNNDNDPN